MARRIPRVRRVRRVRRVCRRLQRQILRRLDGQLSEEETALLERELIRNPSANRLLREYSELDRQCREALDVALAPSGARSASPAPRPAERRPRARRWGAVAAAAAALLAGGLWAAWGVLDGPGADAPTRSAALDRPNPQPHIQKEVPRVHPPRDRTETDAVWPPVRRIDRYRIDVFDEQTNQLHRLNLDHEHLRVPVSWEGL